MKPLLLAAAFLLAAWVARTMSSSMRRLSASAHEIAGQRLPALLTQLTRAIPGRPGPPGPG